METTRTTPLRVSNIRRRPTSQVGRLLLHWFSGKLDTIAKAAERLALRQLLDP
jgi:hypothetical protein